jgi:hypothetical protein
MLCSVVMSCMVMMSYAFSVFFVMWGVGSLCSLIGFIAAFVYVVHSYCRFFMTVYRRSCSIPCVLLCLSCLLCPLVCELEKCFCGFIRVF